ncbi:hypothetical protein AX16_002261 [Volvariella volvacea WC 439]|nr:hypothetical protein AX16_002261 [Volvariella volvacea WC 439]
MASALLWQPSKNLCRATALRYFARSMSTPAGQQGTSSASESQQSQNKSGQELIGGAGEPNTHFKITLRRSAISLGDRMKGTLVSLGLHRRHQTVYHRHSPEVAGKILAAKELLEVENVPESAVRTKQEMRQDRKAPRGYKVVGSRKDTFMHV